MGGGPERTAIDPYLKVTVEDHLLISLAVLRPPCADFPAVILKELSPEIDHDVGGLHRICGHPIGSILPLKGADKGLVLGALHGHKVVPGGIVSPHDLDADGLDLLLHDADGHGGISIGVETGFVKLFEEGHSAIPVQAVKDHSPRG